MSRIRVAPRSDVRFLQGFFTTIRSLPYACDPRWLYDWLSLISTDGRSIAAILAPMAAHEWSLARCRHHVDSRTFARWLERGRRASVTKIVQEAHVIWSSTQLRPWSRL